MLRIIATSDWHLGNLFHGSDRLEEHLHFLNWLRGQIRNLHPDALLIAGDVFDNGNPSAAAQSAYYEFLADVTSDCPEMQIVVTAGNHDSANRLEAPRALLSRHRVEVRGVVHRNWIADPESQKGEWEFDFEDLMIPIEGKDGDKAVILAVPYLRSDLIQGENYSTGVRTFLGELTAKARALYPNRHLVMMTHMYASGAIIAEKDASEKVIIGGLEQISLDDWTDHPDYLTSGHIHKRQHIWNTDWARYSGSVLPMSFAEKDYSHGVDLVSLDATGRPMVEQISYEPQHRLRVIPEDGENLTPAKLKKLLDKELRNREDGELSDHYDYVLIKICQDKVKSEDLKDLEDYVGTKDAVLCKIQRVVPDLNLSTISQNQKLSSIDEILERDHMEALSEAFLVKHKQELSDRQRDLLRDMLDNMKNESED